MVHRQTHTQQTYKTIKNRQTVYQYWQRKTPYKLANYSNENAIKEVQPV